MDVIPLVAQEIVSRYHKQAGERPMGSAITAELTAQLTRLWLMNERERFDDAGDVGLSVTRIEELTNEMLDYLLHRCSLSSLATLSLHVRCEALHTAKEEQRRKADVKKEAIRVQLEGALVAMEPGLASVEQVWGALAVCIVHHYSSLGSMGTVMATTGSSSNDIAHSETLSAVRAALLREQVSAFLRQDRVEQASQLRQLRRITWGLRLYQKEVGRMAGADLMSLSEAADAPLVELEEQVGASLGELKKRLRLTRVLLQSPTCPLDAASQQRLKEEYHHLLLVQHVLRHVDCGLQHLRDRVNIRVMQPYKIVLTELRQLLMPASKSAAPAEGAFSANPSGHLHPAAPGESAPKSVVFPKFMQVADAYEEGTRCASELQHWATLLRVALESAEGYASSLPTIAAEKALALAEEAPASPVTSTKALAVEVTALLESGTTQKRLPAGVRVRYCDNLPLHTVDSILARAYPELLCAMRGYCPVQLLTGRPAAGLLIPGRLPSPPSSSEASIGCVEVSGTAGRITISRPLYFIFADAAAMRTFASDPWRYVEGCLYVLHASDPYLNLVMGNVSQLPRELYLEGARVLEPITSGTANTQDTEERLRDAGTQTGQIDPYFNHQYFWNEWDLRRHALKMANLMHMRTHSTQTAALHYRREASTQADPPKESGTQTLQDAATQPPHVVQYLKGLRGTTTSAIEQVQRVIEY